MRPASLIRIFAMLVLIVFNFILQSVLFPHFEIMGVMPDSALVLIVSYAILRGDIEGAVFGFFAGLVQDLLGGMVIGVFALMGFLTGYFCGKPFRDFFKDNYFLPFFIIILVSLVYQFVYYVGSVLIFGQLAMGHYFINIILPKTIYTASLSVPLYALLHFINSRIERLETPASEI